MRIFALLSWYDEHPDHLRRAVTSLKGFADMLVAVDGAYATFPDAGPLSPASNWQAIAEACVDAGLGFSPHHPYLPAWDNEVAKRAAMFEFGRWASATPEDWFLIIDADMALAEFAPDARDRLETTDRDVADVCWHDVQIDGKPYTTFRFRSMFRALPDLTVERTHWLYMAGRRFLWKTPAGHLSPEPALDLTEGVTLHHFHSQRDAERMRRALAYYQARDAAGLEAVGDWR